MKGKIYIISGYKGKSAVSIVEEYDPVNDVLKTKSPIPTARWGQTSGTADGKIYIIGGATKYPPEKALKSVEVYDPLSDSWKSKTPMPVGRIALAPTAVTLDGKIFIIGGGGIQPTDKYSESYIYIPEKD